MYTIMVKPDHSLHATTRQRIMHRSNMIDKLHILVEPEYNGVDMRKFTCTLEYLLPVSKKYVIETLVPSEELYGNYVEFLLPVTTKITAEPGNVSFKLTFTYLDMDADGNMISYVRHTGSIDIPIINVDRWSDYVAESDLDTVAQIMLTLQSQNEQLREYAEMLQMTKADDIKLDHDANEIYLMADGEKIGDGISVEDLGNEIADETEDGLIKVIT